MSDLAAYLGLTTAGLSGLALMALCAGVVRGFTGFALSAVAMSVGVLILAPVELIPVLWWMEMTASLLMLKGGWAEANRKTAIVLAAGSAVGIMIGLSFTLNVDPNLSRTVALCLLIVLAFLQLAKVRMAFLATGAGMVVAGVASGVATGLAGVGGMVVALYVLSQQAPAREMRGTLVLYLFLTSLASFTLYTGVGTMDSEAMLRGLTLAIPTALGVFLGQLMFNPRFETYYKPVCLSVLIGLASLSLYRMQGALS